MLKKIRISKLIQNQIKSFSFIVFVTTFGLLFYNSRSNIIPLNILTLFGSILLFHYYPNYYDIVKSGREDLEIFTASTTDNKSLPDSYVKSLKSRYSADLQEMYIHGRFVDMSGKLIKPNWFKRFNTSQAGKDSAIIHYAIDSAYGLENSDATAIMEFSIVNNMLFVWKVHELNLSFPDLIKYIKNLVTAHRWANKSMIYIEPKASGISVVQQLKAETMLNVISDKPPTESKFSRVTAITGILESERVYLADNQNWETFLYQCSQFTGENGFRDDMVDALCIAISKLPPTGFNMEDLILDNPKPSPDKKTALPQFSL
jgi:predicted phage terminase large subunit-like protein